MRESRDSCFGVTGGWLQSWVNGHLSRNRFSPNQWRGRGGSPGGSLGLRGNRVNRVRGRQFDIPLSSGARLSEA